MRPHALRQVHYDEEVEVTPVAEVAPCHGPEEVDDLGVAGLGDAVPHLANQRVVYGREPCRLHGVLLPVLGFKVEPDLTLLVPHLGYGFGLLVLLPAEQQAFEELLLLVALRQALGHALAELPEGSALAVAGLRQPLSDAVL